MQKIKSLMTRQGLKSPPESLGDLGAVESLRVPGKEEFRELREQPCDPQAEQELINSIEEVYFSADSFDIVKYELEKLPPVLNLQELEEYRDKLKQQQAAVSKKVADLILEKQPAYVKELERVTSLQTGLQLAAVICTNGRRHLNIAKEGFTQASLGLLANQRKRQLLIGLLKSLRTIKTLQRTDVRLSEMLEEEDYPGAIQLCLECQKAASTFKHYSCISELNSKLQDTLEQIEEQLDVALSKICKNFDINHYTKVQQAYRLLGKTQTAMDQLHMHFTQAIHNTVFQVVLGYVELCAGNTDTKFQKLQYKDLCTHVTPDSYIPCLADLCKALWEVMLSYYRTMEWHEKHDNEDTASASEGSSMMGTEETNFDRGYVKKKLEHGLTRIWTRLDELRMFLENETWELCPVKSNFSILQLHEFKFMEQSRSPSVSPSKQPVSTSSKTVTLFEQYCSGGNPFEIQANHKDEETEDVLASNGETCVSRETLKSRKKSDYSLNKVNAPILTNTTLNVIRLVGVSGTCECSQLESTGLGLSSSRLRTTLNRIQESLIDLEVSADPTATLTAAEERKEKVPSPHLSHLVVLTSGDTLYGLAERVVATESLVFLAEQFEFLQPHLDAVMPAVKKPFLQQFYSQTVSTASELRKPIYWIVAGKAIDYEQMLLLMATVKWDVKEIMSQHNIYVDALLKEFEQFNRRLSEVSKRVRIPLPVSNILWEHCIRLANRTIVEGYANVKKCSNEGRALMQLDFQQFLMKLEKLTDIRPIPDKEFVETYIKAYYLTENDMERWIKEHREYSTKQLTNLVNVCLGSHINKKARQKLLAAIDDIDRPKR
ncbi:PREDICTED: coiled-coil domain-containing protein 132 [Propithecus coquereli]|uniref:coiled-coil domain-containing protein 132 n=1 Tax=Propithecus coquereli TaxID=379532 RepID=UPI00063FAB8A|nr:PREDICTED: coiled-coil domain-containing protein 132 [Propithecus coquereli]